MKNLSRFALAGFLTAFLTSYAVGQNQAPPSGTVTGFGMVELKRQPDTLRIQVDVLAKGKDLQEALARLKEARAAAVKKLTAFGVARDACEFGEPAIGSDKTDRQRQLEMMVRQQMRMRKKGAAAKVKPPVVVSVALKAELPLAADGPEDLLLRATDLEDKIRAADLGGTKQLKQLSPQEEELAEEAAETPENMESNEPKRGEPVFLFVRKVSEEERSKAMADAFQKAKQAAAGLASAAGAGLGRLYHLDRMPSGSGYEDMGMYENNPYAYRLMQRLQASQASGEESREALGMQPGKVTFRVGVSATFVLQGGR